MKKNMKKNRNVNHKRNYVHSHLIRFWSWITYKMIKKIKGNSSPTILQVHQKKFKFSKTLNKNSEKNSFFMFLQWNLDSHFDFKLQMDRMFAIEEVPFDISIHRLIQWFDTEWNRLIQCIIITIPMSFSTDSRPLAAFLI